jgi:hypothetical protein
MNRHLVICLVPLIWQSSCCHHAVKAFAISSSNGPLLPHHDIGGKWSRNNVAAAAVTSSKTNTKLNAAVPASPYLSADQVFFDIAVDGQEIGRLVFSLTIPSALPTHAQRLIDLCQSKHYVGSAFDYGADYVETESRYRWCHILRGRPVAKTIATDYENMRHCKHDHCSKAKKGTRKSLHD